MLKRIIFTGIGLLLFIVFAAQVFLPVQLNADRDELDKQVKEKLEFILNSEEFSAEEKEMGFFESIAEKLVDILEYFKEILNSNQKAAGKPIRKNQSGKTGAILDLTLSIAIIMGILALIGFMLYKQFYQSKSLQSKHGSMLVKMANKPEAAKQLVLEYYHAGDYNQAFRYLYLGLLVDLNKLNMIKIDKSKTNRQYLREAQRNGYQNYKVIERFTWAFNDYWYGNQMLSKDDFDKWHSAYNELWKGDAI